MMDVLANDPFTIATAFMVPGHSQEGHGIHKRRVVVTLARGRIYKTHTTRRPRSTRRLRIKYIGAFRVVRVWPTCRPS